MDLDDADGGIVLFDLTFWGLEPNTGARFDRFSNEPLKINAFLSVRVAACSLQLAACSLQLHDAVKSCIAVGKRGVSLRPWASQAHRR